MITLSDRIERIGPSEIFIIASKAKQMKRAGKDVLSLSIGEPDFDTPQFIKDAAVAAMERGETGYTAVAGTPEVKQAVITKFKRDNGLEFDDSEVLVSTGAKQSLYNLFHIVLNPGDEAVVPSPYWASYPDMIALTGANVKFIETSIDQRFKITPEQLDAALSDKTRLFLFNSPSNPTGVAYTPDELRELADVLVKYPNVLIVSDDIYEHIYWADEPFQTMLNVAPELREQIVIVNGVSKSHAMTGWRMGFIGGPARLVKAVSKLQSQCTSSPNAIAQAATAAALTGDQQVVHDMAKEFKARHDKFIPWLNEIDGLRCPEADGAFYAFAEASECIARAGFEPHDDAAWCKWLIEEHLLAVIPGSCFGAPGHVRFSYASDLATLEQAVGRLRTASQGKKRPRK